MGFVFKPIKKVVDKVVDIVEDTGDFIEDEIIDPITDVLDDAADWVVDEIVDPVVDMGQSILEAAGEDPLKTIATIAAIATGNAWMIPLIDGAAVLADGGDFEDAAKAAAISYVATTVGATAGTYASAAASTAGTSTVVANVIGAGTKSATTALVYGQDPLDAFLVGGTNAFVAASLGKVSETMTEKFGESFEDLNNGVKDSIYAGISAEVSGGALSPEQLSNVIMKNAAIGGTMSKFLQENAGFDATQAAILTNAVSSAVTKTILGNPDAAGEAFFDSISAAGAEALKVVINKPVNNAIDKVSGAYGKTETAAVKIKELQDNAKTIKDKHDALYDTLLPKIEEQDGLQQNAQEKKRLLDEFKATNPVLNTENTTKLDFLQKEALDASAAYTDFKDNLLVDYNENYKNKFEEYKTAHSEAVAVLPAAEKEYENALSFMTSEYEDLDVSLKPIMSAAEKAIALSLNPGIDEDSYRKLNNLESDVDVFGHYLENASTAQVFDPADLNDYLGKIPYGRGYIYDEETNRYFVDTPDGAVEVDPYIELLGSGRGNTQIGSGRGGDPKDYADDIAQGYVSQFRKNTPVEFAGRITGDMHSILGDDAQVGGIILGSHFKKLKDAGYSVVPYRDPTLGKTVDGTVEYSEMVENFENYKKRIGDEDLAMSMTVYDPEYGVMQQPVEYTGKTFTFDGTTPITEEIQNIVREAGGYDDAYIEQYFPVGGMLDRNKQGMLPTDVIDAFYDAGYTPPDYEIMEKLSVAEMQITGPDFPLASVKAVTGILGNTASIALDTAGQLLEASSGLSVIVGNSPDNYAGIAADWVLNLSADLQSDEWNKNDEKMQEWKDGAVSRWEKENPGKVMTEMDKSWATVKAMGGNLKTYPGQNLSINLGGELLNEMLIIGAASKVANLTKKAFLTAGEKEATKIAGSAAVSTSIGLNMIEAYGDTASSSWDLAYETALRANGGDETAASKTALEVASLSASTALVVTAITAGIGGDVLYKNVFGKNPPPSFLEQYNLLNNKVVEAIKVGGVEFGTEALEEGIPALVTATLVKEVDPNFDANTYVTESTTMGAFTGGSTGAAISFSFNDSADQANLIKKITNNSNPTAEFLPTINPKIAGVLSNTSSDDGKAEATAEALKDLGVVDNVLLNNLLNTSYDTQYISTVESAQMFKVANPDYVPTNTEVEAFVSNRPESEVASIVASYVDNRYLSVAEVQEAAEASGVELTDAQIKNYIGQKPAGWSSGYDALDTILNVPSSSDIPFPDLNYEAFKPKNPASETLLVEDKPDDKPSSGEVPDGITPPPAGSANSAVVVDYVNEITGETYSAPSSGFTPVEGSGWVVNPPASETLPMPIGPTPEDNVNELIPAEPVDDPLTADDVQDIIDTAIGNLPESATPEDVSDTISDALAGMNNLSDADVTVAIENALADMNNLSTEDVQEIVDDATEENAEAISDLETNLTGDISDLEADLTTLIEANNGDVTTALDELANNLNTTEENILAELNTTEANLTEKFEAGVSKVEEAIGGVEGTLGELSNNLSALGIDVDTVADLIGKPAREVTETDVDFVIDLIAQENVNAELITQYDVTGDGLVDINDQNMLMDNLQGNDVAFADTSMFNPATGLYLQQEQDTQATMDAITNLNTNINTNINTQTNALVNQSRDEEFRRMRDAGIFQGATMSATTPDKAQIDYFYDFDTIFANPQQAQLFASPYGDVRQNQPVNPSDVKRKRGFSEGGQVEDENDMLLRILGDM